MARMCTVSHFASISVRLTKITKVSGLQMFLDLHFTVHVLRWQFCVLFHCPQKIEVPDLFLAIEKENQCYRRMMNHLMLQLHLLDVLGKDLLLDSTCIACERQVARRHSLVSAVSGRAVRPVTQKKVDRQGSSVCGQSSSKSTCGRDTCPYHKKATFRDKSGGVLSTPDIAFSNVSKMLLI